ncbi:TPA: hypothetical protein ACH3X2_006608 [Trebouxia sp. C0005]
MTAVRFQQLEALFRTRAFYTKSVWLQGTCVASLSLHIRLCRDLEAVCDVQAISSPLLPVAPAVLSLRTYVLFACLAPACSCQPLTRSPLVQGEQPASTRRHRASQHLLLWKAQAFFFYTSVVLTPSILHAHRLWQPSLLHKQALLLQSENLESLVLITRLDTDTALITSSYAHSLCDHDAHQPATSACHPAAEASPFAAE